MSLQTEEGALSGQLGGSVQPRQIAGTLISALTDPDTGVAAEASSTLTRSAAQPDGYELLVGEGGRQELQRVLGSSDPSIRMRGLSLLASLASVAQDNIRALHDSGLLQPLQAELSNTTDILTCSAALALVGELSEASSSASSALMALLEPQLSALQHNSDPFLRSQALKAIHCLPSLVSATLLASSAQQPTGAVANGHAGADAGPPPLLQSLAELLDPDSLAEPSADLVEAALDAVSRLGASPSGAELFFADAHGLPAHVATLALGRAGGTQIRTAALHALGIVAGAHRADHAMSAPAEDTFRQVTFTAAAGPSGFQAPAELLLGFLRQPFADLRTGAYRLLRALAQRTWGAAEVCRNAQLMERLGDPRSETTAQEWRFAIVQALAKTVREATGAELANGASQQRDALRAAAPQVDRAVQQGLYGRGAATHRPPDVAMMST
ncbi:ARM repeat-containing protein [Coccomyxa subellipsoidea C-169]|uniref:ARM repeat-containing protein n=1 Tax=Coccomyxa subellipsoidea (strain C-169) TaxID=574566 RepID=I0Z998_COCSC|nr:ARM repeat-containing protein [Coccomyxa subellipsoidea C-169]EIE27217.1 ARM repeat-containing protein [Coccomyxa subellipsoidea C-169]|eukprot:XP_005651761.1 ARM repeat-containing protein [Coccomyxa subellipsoidea C-169]